MAISVSYNLATGGAIAIPLDKIVKMRVIRKYYDPIRLFYVECILDTPPASEPVIVLFTVNGVTEVFVVKDYSFENNVMTILGQSLAYKILDAGVLPGEKYAFSSANLTSEYIIPYYSKGTEFPAAPSWPMFFWHGNISAWDVVEAYCRQRFERIPRINEKEQISVYTLNSKAHISLGNLTSGTKAITEKEQIFSVADGTKGVIRKIYVNQNMEGEAPDFSHVENNPYNITNNIQKIMYWTPKDAYTLLGNSAARTMIYQSMMAKTKVKLKYPMFYHAHTGDVVKFKDSRYAGGALKYMYIGAYEASFEGGMWSTSIQLWDTKYLFPWASAELNNKGIPAS